MIKNNYNKLIFSLIIVILITILVIVLVYFSIEKKEEPIQNTSTKTIMIYMVGSNLESDFASASSDLEEISTNIPNLNDVNVVVYLGGSKLYHNSYLDSDENVILKLTDHGFETIIDFPAKNMGTSDTLSYFINYISDLYKTDEYSLILWDHGGGPLIGYGLDETTNDILTLSEIKNALDNTKFNGDNKLGFIGFDACLMASFEVANLFAPYSNYLIASEEVIPGDGWDYAFLKDISKSDDTVIIGEKIINNYFNYYENITNMYDLTLSLFDLSKIENLNSSLNSLFNYLNKNLSTETFANFVKTRVKSKTFGDYSSSTKYDLVDLYDLVQLTGGDLANQVINNIDDLIIYNKANIKRANGLTIYYPYSNKAMAVSSMSTYKKFNVVDSYYKYIVNFTNILIGKPIKKLDISSRAPVITSSGSYDFTFTLTDDELANFSSAGYNIFRRNEEGYYELLYVGNDAVLEGNTLKANIHDKGIKVVTNEEESDNIVLLLYDTTDEYRRYITPVMLTNISENMDFSDYKMQSGYLQLAVYNNGNIEALGIVPMDDYANVAPKKLTNLNDWKTIQFLKMSYNIFDSNGNYTSNWEGSGTITGWEFGINDIKSFEKYDFLQSEDEYYCIFVINDSQGNVSYSQPVLLNKN